jgi:signal transduction histidine kinase
MKLEILRGQFPMTPEQELQYQSMINDLNTIIEDIRLYIRNLRTAREEQATFKQRLDNLARHFHDFARVEVVVDVPSKLRTLTERQRHSLVQIVREGLSNVARHAQATQVEIKVREVGNNLLLTVKDNGRGFDPSKFRDPASFGLHNMHQRAIQLGGTLTIDSEEGQGTRLTVKIPFRP